MIKTYTAVFGQSLYDVCLMTYGSLDYLFKLISDNNILGVNTLNIVGITFKFDATLVRNAPLANYNTFYNVVYATNVQLPAPPPDTSIELRDDGGDELRDDGGLELRD